MRLEGLGQLKNSSDLTGKGTRDLPACSIMPESTTLPRAPAVLASAYFSYGEADTQRADMMKYSVFRAYVLHIN
jgi:hypothetical protein